MIHLSITPRQYIFCFIQTIHIYAFACFVMRGDGDSLLPTPQ